MASSYFLLDLFSFRLLTYCNEIILAFLLLVFVWLGATVYKIQTCLQIGVEFCK